MLIVPSTEHSCDESHRDDYYEYASNWTACVSHHLRTAHWLSNSLINSCKHSRTKLDYFANYCIRTKTLILNLLRLTLSHTAALTNSLIQPVLLTPSSTHSFRHSFTHSRAQTHFRSVRGCAPRWVTVSRRTHALHAGYTLKGSANWCRGAEIPGMSQTYSDNAGCEKACTENPKCQYYGRYSTNAGKTMCEFFEASACEGNQYYTYVGHSVYQKHNGLCWLSRTLVCVSAG